MTAAAVIYQRPNRWPRGYLQDCAIRCPQCGSHHRIGVAVTAYAVFTEDGTAVDGDQDYTPQSAAYCGHCQHEGVLADFTDYPGPGDRRYDKPAVLQIQWRSGEPADVWPGLDNTQIEAAREIGGGYWPGVRADFTDDGLTLTVTEPDVPGMVDRIREDVLWNLGPPTID